MIFLYIIFIPQLTKILFVRKIQVLMKAAKKFFKNEIIISLGKRDFTQNFSTDWKRIWKDIK